MVISRAWLVPWDVCNTDEVNWMILVIVYLFIFLIGACKKKKGNHPFLSHSCGNDQTTERNSPPSFVMLLSCIVTKQYNRFKGSLLVFLLLYWSKHKHNADKFETSSAFHHSHIILHWRSGAYFHTCQLKSEKKKQFRCHHVSLPVKTSSLTLSGVNGDDQLAEENIYGSSLSLLWCKNPIKLKENASRTFEVCSFVLILCNF